MSPFEEKLEALLHEGLRSVPNAGVVGALVGAALAATIADGREPREVFGVVTDAISLLEGPEKGRATAYATQMSILIEKWLEKDSDPDRVILAILGMLVGVRIANEQDPRALTAMTEKALRLVLTPGAN